LPNNDSSDAFGIDFIGDLWPATLRLNRRCDRREVIVIDQQIETGSDMLALSQMRPAALMDSTGSKPGL
jgi:hypothetical protein